MNAIDYLPAFPVPHPGELLREEILPAAGLRPAQAAERMGVSRQSLHAVLSERAGISADMALRFAALFGNSPLHWLNMQALYDLQRSRERIGEEIHHIQPVAA
jgi:addiction module HigA family antidote